MRNAGFCIALGLILAVSATAGATSGDISLTIRDLYGNNIAPGANVKGDMWGASQPKGGGAWTWHHIVKPAVSSGAGSMVSWTAAEVDAQVDLTANNFYIALNAWGGSPWANSQICDSSALWSTFFRYEPSLGEKNWDINVITSGGFPGMPSESGVSYSLDLGTVAMTDSWASVNITYEGCAHDVQPAISAKTKAYMTGQGYVFDETLLLSNGLLRITNVGTGFDETFSGRSDGAGGYIQELETLGYGTTSYDDTNDILDVQIDFASLGLGLGDTYFCKPGFMITGPSDTDYTNLETMVTPGYVGHTLDSLTVVPEPMTMAGLFMGVAGLAGYIRKRRMA